MTKCFWSMLANRWWVGVVIMPNGHLFTVNEQSIDGAMLRVRSELEARGVTEVAHRFK